MTDRSSSSFEAALPRAGVSFVLAACDSESRHPALDAVRIAARDGELLVEATDTYRVHRLSVPQPPPTAAVLVPHALLAAAVAAGADPIELTVTDTAATVRSASGVASVELATESFPNTAALDRPDPTATLALAELAKVLGELGELDRNHVDVVRLEVSDTGFTAAHLTAPTNRRGDPTAFEEVASLDVAATWAATPSASQLEVDAHYLADAVRCAMAAQPSAQVKLSIAERLLTLTVVTTAGWSVQALISPRRLS